MKKKLLLKHLFLLWALIAGSTSVWAEDTPITFNLSGTNGVAIESVSSGDVTITFAKGTNTSNAPTWYDNGSALRFYSGNTITFASSGAKITKVVLTNTESQLVGGTNGENFPSGGSYTVSNKVETWTASTALQSFTVNITNKPRLTKIEVYLEEGTPKTPIATIGDISLSEIEIGEGTIPLAGLLAYITFAEGKTVTDCVPTITSDDTSVLEISISGTNLAYNAKKAGQATLTLTLTPTDTENYTAVSKQLTVTVVDPNAEEEVWELTDLANLTESDVFVIVGNNGDTYAMSNDKGTTGAPTAVSVTVSDNKLTGTIAENIKWNISGNATDGYTFYPNGSTTTWLYCTSDNNGVRVGTTNSNDYDKFKINSNYIYNIGRARYLGIYSSSDWRCYTSINSNISGQSFAFYKKVTGDVLTPSIVANDVELAYDAKSGEISFTINNPVDNPSPTGAFTQADWISNVSFSLTSQTEGKVTFTTTANNTSAARTATIELRYEDATKIVNVTQAAAPATLQTIAEVRAQGTGNVKTQGIVTSCVGTTGYIQDATAAICVYGTSLTVGDMITVEGTLSTFNGLLEITSPTVSVVSSGNTVTPEVMTIAQVNSSTNQGWFIKIEEATVSAISDKNVTIAQGENTVTVRFGSTNDITFVVNDVITLTGNIGCYNTIQVVNPTNVEVQTVGNPIINAVDEITLEAEATSGEIAYTITNPVAGTTLTATVGDSFDWISNIQVTADKVTFTVTPNQNGDHRLNVMYLHYGSVQKNVTIIQEAYIPQGADVTNLPFTFNDGVNSVAPCDGLSQDGLGSDYSSSPYLKFDSTGDWLLLHFNERPGTLTFDIKGNTFSGGTFKVQTSADGTTFTDLKAYTELGDTQHESFDNLGEDVRYIKWIYTNKSSGNVALGNIHLDSYDPTPSITVNPNVVNATAAESDGTLTVTYKNVEVSAGVEVQFCNANGGDAEYDWIDVEINDENNVDYIVFENTGEARTAYLKVYGVDAESNDVYSNIVTITQAAPVTERSRYEKVTSTDDITDGQYLIVYEDGSLAFDGDLDALDAEGNTIEVEIADDMIVASTTTRAAEFTIVKEADADTYTIKSASGFYIGQSSDSNGMKVSETTSYSHSISFSGTNNDADLVSNGAHLRFNSASNQNRFRYYKSSSYANQQAIQLYKYIPVTVPVTVTEYKWATLSSEYAMDFSAMTDLKAYIVRGDNGSTILTEEVSGKVKAGTGLLLYSEKAGNYDIPIAAEAGTDYSDFNKLIAVTKKMTVNKADDGTTNYVLTVNNDKAVFAYINNTPAVLRKGQAYLNLEGEPSAPYLGFDGEGTTGIVNVNRETITNNQYYTLDGRRVENPSNGVYIVNGKKVVIK